MNREILFRGQHRRKGERVWMDGTPVESKWVYGGVCQGEGDFSIIYQTEPDIHKFPVYTDTLGQFTGLYDSTKWESLLESEQKEWLKNHTADEWKGRRIFEGDIVKYKDKIYEIRYFTTQARFLAILPNRMFNPAVFLNCEVIGNVHDNPELMKGETNV